MFVISGLVDIGILMTGYAVPAVSSPEASSDAPMVASASNRPLPPAARVLAGAAQLITFPVPVNADPGACPVVSAVAAVKALARACFAQKKVST